MQQCLHHVDIQKANSSNTQWLAGSELIAGRLSVCESRQGRCQSLVVIPKRTAKFSAKLMIGCLENDGGVYQAGVGSLVTGKLLVKLKGPIADHGEL